MKEKIIKSVVSFLLVGSYFFLPKYGFTSFVSSAFPDGLLSNFLYPFSHANIWHLLGNILCLWMLRCPTHIFSTYIIAVLCSFLPSFPLYDYILSLFSCTSEAFSPQPTYGFSGILFAMVGISWGRIHRFRDMLSRNKWFLIITAFIPHINFLIHIYCLLAGYLYGTIIINYQLSIINLVKCARK